MVPRSTPKNLTPRQRALRDLILLTQRIRRSSLAHHRPFSWGIRWIGNRLVPWAARTAFEDRLHVVNGICMEIPRPPDWGGGGEFHMALGTYEPGELAYILGRLQPGDTFLDVGAHIGYFTLPIAKRVGPRGRVIAVEPVTTSAAYLRRNIALNGFDWITLIEAAASDEDGQALLTVSSLSAMWSTLRQGTLDGETGTLPVPTRKLDSVLAEQGWPAVAGMKLDVEGAEANVLRGSTELLARNPRAFLLFEVSGGAEERVRASLESLRFLEQHGYHFRRLTEMGATRVTTVAELVPLLHAREWQESLFNLVAERPPV